VSSSTILSDAGGSERVLAAITVLLEICTLTEVASDVEYSNTVDVCSITEVSKVFNASASKEVDVETSMSAVEVWSWSNAPMMVTADPLDTEKAPSRVPQSHNPRSASGAQQKTIFPQAIRSPQLSSTGSSTTWSV